MFNPVQPGFLLLETHIISIDQATGSNTPDHPVTHEQF
jgi:hypothetical protein